MLQKNTYLKNAVLLTGASLFVRAIGMLFRVYVAAELGAEGMGLQQLVFSVYGVGIAAATAGISVAATRIAAQANRRNAQVGMRQVLKTAFWLGTAAGILQFLAAEPASVFLLADRRAIIPLQVLSVSLPFMAVGGGIRGYFLAQRKVEANVFSQITEQLIRVVVVYLLFRKFAGESIGTLCVCLVLGNVVSEAISCGMMWSAYHREKQPCKNPEREEIRRLKREIWGIMLPLEGSKGVSTLLHAAENAMVPACLTLYLSNRTEAMTQFGALRGMAFPLVFFPFSILATLSTLLLPEVTRAYTAGRREQLERLIGKMMFFTGGISVLAGGLCTIYGGRIAELVYHDAQVGEYLCLLGPILPLMYLESMVDGVLKGMGEQLATFRYSVIDSVLRIAGIALLLPHFGIHGFIFLMACSNFFTCSLNTLRMLKKAEINTCWKRWLGMPAAFLAASLAAARLLENAAEGIWGGPSGVWPMIAAGACYMLLWGKGGFWREVRNVSARSAMPVQK